MTPLEAAALLQQWAAKAKTNESREACEMAAEALHNSAKTRKLAELKNGGVVIHYARDEQGDQFIVSAGHSVVGARRLSDALDGLLEKIGKKEANPNGCA